MYDTMPITQPDLWKAPPFEARLMEQPPYPKVLIGRGANNSKGRQMAFLNTMMSIKAVRGSLPLNVIFVAEVASTFNEQLLSRHLMDRAGSPEERARYAAEDEALIVHASNFREVKNLPAVVDVFAAVAADWTRPQTSASQEIPRPAM